MSSFIIVYDIMIYYGMTSYFHYISLFDYQCALSDCTLSMLVSRQISISLLCVPIWLSYNDYSIQHDKCWVYYKNSLKNAISYLVYNVHVQLVVYSMTYNIY